MRYVLRIYVRKNAAFKIKQVHIHASKKKEKENGGYPFLKTRHVFFFT